MERPAVEPLPPASNAPLSFAQERLWFLDRLQPGSAAYVMPAALRLAGRLDVAALRTAFEEVTRRHSVLRATFAEAEGLPVQSIRPPVPLPLPVVDLAALPVARREPEASRLARAAAREPFDLETGPLLRLRLLRLAETEHLAVLTIHHIAADGWSLGVLAREVAALYQGAPLPAPPVQYADFAAWQRGWLAGGVLDAQLAWWRERLAGAPDVLELPADHSRPALPTLRGGSRPFALSAELTARLREIAHREGSTPFMLLLAAFQTFLHRLTGEDDLSVGTPIAGRTRIETEGLIGLFVNTLVMRGDLAGDPTFRELLARTRETSLAAHAHQDLPFEKLVEALRPERGLDRSPLFQVLLVLQNAAGEPAEIPGLELRPEALPAGGAKLDLSLSLTEGPDGLSGLIEYAADLFDAVTIARWERHLATLLGSLATVAEEIDRPLSVLPLLSEEERHQLRAEWCDTAAGDRRDSLCLHALLAEAAGRVPDAVAVVSERGELTYRELDRWSRSLAAQLRAAGIGEGSFVPLLMDSGPELVVGMLAAMRAGAAFVPLDVEWPAARLTEVLDELAGPSRGIVLVDGASPVLPGRQKLRVERGQDRPAVDLPDPHEADPESPIYAIYTSGSTGRPKAVVVPHRGIVNRFLWMDRRFGGGAAERVLQTTRCVYDSVVWQIFWPLTQGGRTVLTPARLGLDPDSLAGLIERHGITMADFVPSIFNVLVERLESGAEPLERLATLRAVVVGGEEMEIGVAKAFRRLFPQVHLVNLYGPTEASIGCICHTVGDERGGRVPIGRPISNVAPRVLDRWGGPVPVGVPGELYLAGRCVGHGYLGDEEKTRRAFVADPLAEGRTAAYRTGDRVRWLPDGRIDFLGRIDQQVKIRGLRIEPGEIEAALRRHPDVAQAVVLAAGAGADRRLVAYVTSPQAESRPELRGFLAERLPAAMVPSAFVFLEALPLSAGGKVDRKALAALVPDDERREAFVAPRTPAEEVLAGIWAEVLGGERPVGAHDDFFALGGHSLLATRVVSRVRRAFGVELPLRALFEAPTVAGLARRIQADAGAGVAPPIVPVARGRELPLSFAQQRLWFMEQLQSGGASGGALYNLLLAARLSGPLDPERLALALEVVARRHESLRTSFPVVDGQPVQAIAPAGPVPLPVVSLEREEEVRQRIAAEARRPFDLAGGPLLRCELLRLGDSDHVLLASLHHTVCDGWSIGLFERELGAVYEALSRGEEPALPDLPVQYADYSVWQREWLAGEILEREVAWWRGRLDGMPAAIELPADRPRPPVQSFRGARLPFEVAAERSAALRAFGRRRGSTLFMVLLAAFDTLLHRYTGEERLTVGTPTANRGAVEVEPLIGNFANTLIVPVALDGNPPFGELLDRVRDASLAAFAHQDLPFELLVEALSPRRDLSHNPLFQVLFGLHGLPPRRDRLGDLGLAPLPVESGSARFDLALDLMDGPEGLRGAFEYSTDLFDASTLERLRGHLGTLLEGVLAEPEARLSELPLLTAAESRQLLETWNATAAPVPEVCVHELFAAQAGRSPEAVAVEQGEVRWTYGELAARAAALARRLRGSGIGPGARVGVALERSPDMVAVLLGILQAGGTYVPLDPSHPAERRRWILEDAGVAVLLTDGDLGTAPPAHDLPPVPPDLPAYVLYTSGSTGRPKGVQISHRALVNFLLAMAQTPGLGAADALLAVTTLSFDIAGLEIFLPLVVGARVVIATRETAADPARLAAEIAGRGITVLQATPATWRMLVESGWPGDRRLKALCGGEALPADLAQALLGRVGELWNVYGPTETTVWSTVHRVGPDRFPVPVGRPVANTRVYVVDRRFRPVPAGVPGELWIGGAGLGVGYLGRPELTAERFAPDPFAAPDQSIGERVYRTGDLVRWHPDGELEFLGRIDHQVKLRGFRIELGEIEAALLSHPTVAQAAVLALAEGAGRRLVAWLVGSEAPDLRAFLSERLPEYMIPSAFAWLQSLPLSPNGKVDRRALAALAPETRKDEGWVAPRTPVEELLAGIWSEVLAAERVGAHDGFFELGGHSLLAARVTSRIRARFGVELPLRAIFEASTLAALAVRVEEELCLGTVTLPPIEPTPRTGPLPLSFGQERLWFLDQLQPGSAAYNIAGAVQLRGDLHLGAFQAALTEIVRRHESLRTTFAAREGVPVQVIAAASELKLTVVDLGALGADSAAELRRLAAVEASRPFELAAGPLLRGTLVRLGESEHAALLTVHHIVSDGWSMGVLVGELGALYTAFVAGRPSALPPLPVQYADYAVWQRRWLSGEALDAQLAFWRGELAGAPAVLELPADRPRPPAQSYRGGSIEVDLGSPLSERLAALGREQGATLFMTLLAGLQTVLSRTSGQRDLVIGTPVANRTRAEVEGLIGLFINTLALRGDLAGDPTFVELLGRTRERALAAYAHQDLPFEKLVEELQPERSLAHSPLFQVLFTLQNAPAAALDLPGLTLAPAEAQSGAAKLDLALVLGETPAGIRGSLRVQPRPLRRCHRLPPRGAPADPARRRRRRSGFAGNGSATAHRRRAPPDRRLERDGRRLSRWLQPAPRADRPPDRADAGRHRRHLRGRGPHLPRARRARRAAGAPPPRPGRRAGGAGGGLRRALAGAGRGPARHPQAGGAYVPLDPAYPAERLAYLLEDAGRPRAAHPAPPGRHPARARRARDLPRRAGSPARRPRSRPVRSRPTWPTSSTPRARPAGPRAAMNAHRGIVNRLLWMQEAYGLDPADRVLQKTPFSFDVSVWEFFWPLMTGARLVVARPGGHQDPALSGRHLVREGITTLHFVPSMLQAFLEQPGVERCASLRRVIAAARRCRSSSNSVFTRGSPGPSCTTCTVPPRRRWTSPSGPASAAANGAACRSGGRSPTPASTCSTRAPAGAGRRPGRALHRRRAGGPRLSRPARPDRRALRPRPVLDGAGRAPLPHRRSRALSGRRRHRVPRPPRPPGQDPRLPHRAGRDRGRARASTPACARRPSWRARRVPETAAWWPMSQLRKRQRPAGSARPWRSACRSTWSRRRSSSWTRCR